MNSRLTAIANMLGAGINTEQFLTPTEREISRMSDGYILKEYELIKEKKSRASSVQRKLIKRRAKRILKQIAVV